MQQVQQQVQRQVQAQEQVQIQTQRATQNQVLLGELIEMNDEELKNRIEAEIHDNPALEENSDPQTEDYASERDDDSDSGAREGEDPFDSPYAQDNEDYYDDDANYDPGIRILRPRRDNDDNSDYRPVVVNEVSMTEALIEQVHECDLNDRQMRIAEFIIYELDEDGLLRRPIPMICGDLILRENMMVTPDEAMEVLHVIQDLDPPGIAATSTQECILLQIEALRPKDSTTAQAAQLAHTIISKHFKDYEQHNYNRIMNALGIDRDTFAAADKIIKAINPKPGNVFSGGDRMGTADHITPDFRVTQSGNRLHLTVLNNIPELQIVESFKIEYNRIQQEKKRTASKDDILIKKQYEKASNFISLLRQRQEKLFNIMHAIMMRQQEFFITGDRTTLRPLTLNAIAADTGYDQSTVSRARQNKYVDTEWGIFTLKEFFASEINESGISNTAIKQVLKHIVDEEDKSNPLSDDALCKILNEQGFDISRRTVAKYRTALKIPASKHRKNF